MEFDYSAEKLLSILNQQDECDWIEAKGGGSISKSAMETVCAYSNEPGIGGGYILLGVAEDHGQLFGQYTVVGVSDLDKVQKDFASMCSSMFNIPIRPKIEVETIGEKAVVKITVVELDSSKKPLYIEKSGLPSGAFRRVGSTDQRCTEDDLRVFYSSTESYDVSTVEGSSLADIDETAVDRYRKLRENINPAAEELTYNDGDLLLSLGCLNRKNRSELTLAGLLLFGSAKALRAYYPMLRVDYIRVPGNQWVPTPDDRFVTIDMRGPLLTLLFRLVDAINADLPKGFLLSDNELQADSSGLPTKALREAIVNALMHRSYREHRPTQVVRYDNRIEIINPGYSLKAEDRLGEPGSETRNPFIAAVFHETNLAETKGSGIRAMRIMMRESHLAPPMFESDRINNQFTSRLLLLHFLDEKDLRWLSRFDALKLSDGQKQALIFIREVGAIDNARYRQLVDCDVLQASQELRALRDLGVIVSKGKGRATYYIPSPSMNDQDTALSTGARELSTGARELSTEAQELSTEAQELSTEAQELSTEAQELSTEAEVKTTRDNKELFSELIDPKISSLLDSLGKRERDSSKIEKIIVEICSKRAIKAAELATILGRNEDYITRKYLNVLLDRGEIAYLFPELRNHPQQAYVSVKA